MNLLREEMRLKDERMERIPAQRRPYYHPTERLAILELRATRGWSLAQTADRMLVTAATIASWMGRLDEEGPGALVQLREPVNKFPDFVRYIVRRLKVLCPGMGKARIAQVLCRAGLHLSSATVGRMLREWPRREPEVARLKATRRVQANRPDHVWHVDLTTVPTSLGFWVSWFPWTLPQGWPFCWWVAVAVDHYSRRIMGFTVFDQQPMSIAVRKFLGRAIRRAGVGPRHLITDQGSQFTDLGFGRWCRRRNIRQRFGAVGKFGSIAVVERLIRTVKNEGTRKILVPFYRSEFRRELSLFVGWYNRYRSHGTLDARTPDEVYHDLPPACLVPRFEPRRNWPRSSPCAAPLAPVGGRRGRRLDLKVSYLAGRKHLPIVELNRAA
jgi:transposase InsO family protein